MSIKRPGGTELTEHAIELAGVKPGGTILDAGCGDGTVAKMLRDKYGQVVTAIDIDDDMVKAAKEKGVNALNMDAAMLEFDVYEFDNVLMECSFSVFENQEEAIHEAYCVLKPGGALIISDVYCREPDLERWRKQYDEAMALFHRPRLHSECGRKIEIPSPYCQDGAVVLPSLVDLLEELELKVEVTEDHTKELETYAAQAVMDYGSLEKWYEAEGCWNEALCKRKDAGYFLLIARKKQKDA
ncbi:MAG: class I SAM-dependent methyltransferase [Oscillospiraceae bacterium]|nr:class I SAM-dependent methyltransferase [Oscillospiraceae bacterium]